MDARLISQENHKEIKKRLMDQLKESFPVQLENRWLWMRTENIVSYKIDSGSYSIQSILEDLSDMLTDRTLLEKEGIMPACL